MESNTNIGKFKFLILIFSLIAITNLCFSEDSSAVQTNPLSGKNFFKDVNFSLGTGLSYLSGQYREIVYPSAGWESPYLSELLWNLEDIFLLNISFGAAKGPWSLDLSLSTAVTKGSGIMEDYDWLDSSRSAWTNWSESLIFLDKSFFLDINSRYKFTLNNRMSIPVKLGYKLNYLNWEDKTGKYIYYVNPSTLTYNVPTDVGDLGGSNGIDYKVIQNIFYASSGVLFTKGNITTGVTLALSPFIYAWDLDHHINTQTFYIDSFIANFWYRAEATFDIKTGSQRGLLFSAYIEGLPETTGDTYSYNEDPADSEVIGTQTGYYPNGAGIASFMWGIEISYIWTF